MYIAFLERQDRAHWQKPDDVVRALGLTGKETVFDLVSFRLARALPAGKVVAADVEPEMIGHMHHRAVAESARDRDAWMGRIAGATKPGAKLA